MANNTADGWESKIIKLLFQNADAANLGDAGGLRGSVTAGSVYVSLHTGDPGEAGNQTTSEATYGSYARVGVARNGTQWTESGGTIQNANAITFPACTSGSNTITYVGIGTASSGVGELIWSGALTASLAVSAGITPSFASGQLTVQHL